MVPKWFKQHAARLCEELAYTEEVPLPDPETGVQAKSLATLAGSPFRAVALIYARKALSVFVQLVDVYLRRRP